MKARHLSMLLAVCMTSARARTQGCKELVFIGTVGSQETYSHQVSPDLSFRLIPQKGNRGWRISIDPKDSDEDWTAPVTFPTATQERQLMATGYGSTVEEKIAGPVLINFVLTQADFIEYSRLSDESLRSPRPEAVGEDIAKVSSMKKGQVTVEALRYEKGETRETIKWMRFKASVVVPASFSSPGLPWKPISCPAG